MLPHLFLLHSFLLEHGAMGTAAGVNAETGTRVVSQALANTLHNVTMTHCSPHFASQVKANSQLT